VRQKLPQFHAIYRSYAVNRRWLHRSQHPRAFHAPYPREGDACRIGSPTKSRTRGRTTVDVTDIPVTSPRDKGPPSSYQETLDNRSRSSYVDREGLRKRKQESKRERQENPMGFAFNARHALGTERSRLIARRARFPVPNSPPTAGHVSPYPPP